ncbi:hypothetical protein [Streptomyces sp. B29(2018)]|uniref:hypothetical protein n=1 Tax=Streptomyces sp. B29(2018) TaxID=2485016 RepID=UPI001F0C6D48|nr:hypothetical protein [Streptomyces sp. B29(2018)]
MAGARPAAADLEAAGLEAAGLEAAGLAGLTAPYTAAQAHRPALARAFTAQAEEDTLRLARQLRPDRLLTAERRARAATDTARVLLDAGDAAGAFTQLRLVEAAAPLEAHRPAVRALTTHVAGLRPGLPGLRGFVARTVVSPG